MFFPGKSCGFCFVISFSCTSNGSKLTSIGYCQILNEKRYFQPCQLCRVKKKQQCNFGHIIMVNVEVLHTLNSVDLFQAEFSHFVQSLVQWCAYVARLNFFVERALASLWFLSVKRNYHENDNKNVANGCGDRWIYYTWPDYSRVWNECWGNLLFLYLGKILL